MVTASDLPFELRVIKRFPDISYQDGVFFSNDAREIWKKEIITLSIEENDDIEILFNSKDSNAKLYLEALDIVPIDDRQIAYDEDGHIYRMPSDEPFILYKGNSDYDALCVDIFQITVFCFETWYYGTLQVLPKPMNVGEWTMMKDELEKEMVGLAQDIVRRNIGIGKLKDGNLPPKILYDFIVIKKYAQSVLSALLDIAENPRCEIVTQYKKMANNRNCRLDEESIRRFATRAGSEATYKVPEKVTNYDIQDNRLLKRIVLDYEKRLNQFLELLEEIYDYSKTFDSGKTKQYKNEWEKSILEFRLVARKLKKMTSLLKTKDWYFEVRDITQAYIPHSFIMDIRYNTLYQMYLELKKDTFQIEFDSEFSYTWKRSSYLYEMWCYFKVVHLLAAEYEMDIADWNSIFTGKILFPFLDAGTIMEFNNGDIYLKVVFDSPLVFHSKKTDENMPLYIAKTQEYSKMHNRPDILIHVYDMSNNWYLGSIVLECKYRKINSFWNENSQRSSIGQLQAYYNNTRSEYHFGGKGRKLNILPVKKVIVLTPDTLGDGKSQDDFNILIKGFKPTDTEEWSSSLTKELSTIIAELRQTSLDLQH
ncbi:MAG: DUF2357 domain-containing protein [Lachnospiraceae bacterium]|nr:DUF2357 domain-containing protein [Lachnospiraceae bacterium]